MTQQSNPAGSDPICDSPPGLCQLETWTRNCAESMFVYSTLEVSVSTVFWKEASKLTSSVLVTSLELATPPRLREPLEDVAWRGGGFTQVYSDVTATLRANLTCECLVPEPLTHEPLCWPGDAVTAWRRDED